MELKRVISNIAQIFRVAITGPSSSNDGSYPDVKVSPTGGLVVNDPNMSFSFTSGITFDYWEAEYPTATQEIFRYYEGGPSGTLVRTVTINYVDATKIQILNGGFV